jgi:small subunit ribosomal protein S1
MFNTFTEEVKEDEILGEEGTSEQEKQDEELSFQALYEESLKQIEEGAIVTGTVISINPDTVLVDVGYKSEGEIPIFQFKDPQGNITIEEGDKVEVLVVSREDDEGIIHISKEKADKIKAWREITKACNEGAVIEGTIVARVKGGMSVDIGGVIAFLPGSQIDIRPIRNMDELVGQSFKFKVLKLNEKRNNIVISRRALLEEEREKKRKELLEKIEENVVLEGTVKNITEYGAFIDLDGLDGLLHITDMSWGRINHPSEILSIGDTINVKVIKYDHERQRVSLGLKQLSPDPWENIEEKYPIGVRIKGKVVSITDYGAFIELEEGVEGMVHVTEMAWGKKLRHPSKIVDLGEMVEIEVIGVDPEKKRISLSMKQLEKDPWQVVEEKYPVGTKIVGRIKTVTNFGVFVGLGEGVDGLVHVSDMSWTKKIRNPADIYKKGQEIEAVVLKIDRENERFSLGIKQLLPNPWDTIDEKFPIGKVVNGVVTNLTDFGAFVDIGEDLEGLIHISELSDTKVDKVSDVVSVGDAIEAVVINLNKSERKIGLSLKARKSTGEKQEYTHVTEKREETSSNFGALLKEKLDEKEAAIAEAASAE